nr:glycosyltransferase family A protein [Halomonas sp. UBA3074]
MKNELCLPITVIVPTFNDGDYLSEALNSILLQSNPPERLIVVDDGSYTDDAEKTVSEYRKNEQLTTQIVYFKQANKGPSAARNAGLKLVKTPYVTFLDADDRMLPNNLASMWQALAPLVDDYFGVYGTYCDYGTGKPYHYGNFDGHIAADKVGRKRGLAGGVHTYLFRTYHLKSVNGFDESLVNNEDYDLIIRLLRAGLKCKGKISICFQKRNRIGSLSRPWEPSLAFNSTFKFLQKAEDFNYFSTSELQARKLGAKLTYAKNLMDLGKESAAKAVWKDALSGLPSSKRELYHWLIYLYVKLKSKT